jgi:hypothetical protein
LEELAPSVGIMRKEKKRAISNSDKEMIVVSATNLATILCSDEEGKISVIPVLNCFIR